MAQLMLKEELNQFKDSTTFHGVSNMTNRQYPLWIRVTWLVMFLLMVAVYLFMMITTLIAYFEYHVVTNVDYRTVGSIDFPSVTICNKNVARYSAISKNDTILSMYQTLGMFKSRPLPKPNNPGDPSKMDMFLLSKELAHQPQDMLLECGFNGIYHTPCVTTTKFSWTRNPLGFCQTFNSAELIEKYGTKKTTRPGSAFGLQVLINIELDEYYIADNSSGIQIEVHEPKVLADVGQNGFTVGAGQEAQVIIKRTIVKRLPAPYAKFPNLCQDTYDSGFVNPLSYFSPYSLSACRRECRIEHQLQECGCSAHIYGGENVTFCGIMGFMQCAFPTRVIYDSDPTIQEACNCLPECEETTFDVSVSSSTMPNDFTRQTLVKNLNLPKINSNNIDSNIISLNVFFGEMRYSHIEQESRYTSTSLFGELGGQLGLCLGASVLTLTELVQLITSLCTLLFKRLCGRKPNVVEVIPPKN